MATDVVDAFVLELGLDADKLEAEQRAALSSFFATIRKMEQGGTAAEDQYKKMAEGFESFGKRVLGIATLAIGAVGAKNKLESLILLDRTLGLVSIATGESVEDLSKWRYAFERMGGSAESAMSLIQGLDHEIQAVSAGSAFTSTALFRTLSALSNYGVNISPMDGSRRKRGTEILLELFDAIPKMKTSRDLIAAHLRQLPGMDEQTLGLIMKGSGEFRRFLEEQDKIAKATQESSDQASKLNRAWVELSQRGDQLARSTLALSSGPMVAFLNKANELLAALNKIFKVFLGEEKAPAVNTGPHKPNLLDWINKGLRSLTGGGQTTGGGQGEAGAAGAGGGGASAPTTPPGGPPGVPSEILNQAKEAAKLGGGPAVFDFMRSKGYPAHYAWCGDFAASVITSAGGTPPKNPQIASSWNNWGNPSQAPTAGNVAVLRGVRTGDQGSHVTIVESYDPRTGTFVGIGGNQRGGRRSTYSAKDFNFREGNSSPWVKPDQPALSVPPPVVQKNISLRKDVGNLTVNTQAQDPAAIALEIHEALRGGGKQAAEK